MIYLFLGQDSPSKEAQLKKIKEEFLAPKTAEFNLEILYAKELKLKSLQERLLCLPVNSPKRLIVIKEAQELSGELKEFLAKYALKPYKHLILVLDFSRQDKKDGLPGKISRYAKTLHFKENIPVDTFTLSRQVALGRADTALRILHQLLGQGEPAERILGGLRYAWERDNLSSPQMKKRLKLLMLCDIEIKTGKLKANFALEKLIIALSQAVNTFR